MACKIVESEAKMEQFLKEKEASMTALQKEKDKMEEKLESERETFRQQLSVSFLFFLECWILIKVEKI